VYFGLGQDQQVQGLASLQLVMKVAGSGILHLDHQFVERLRAGEEIGSDSASTPLLSIVVDVDFDNHA
jgi:hypothetical protein